LIPARFNSKVPRAVGGRFTLHIPTRHFFNNFDVSFQRLHRPLNEEKWDKVTGVDVQLKKGQFLGEFAYSAENVVRGSAEYFRQGYYVQPSYRITSRLVAVIRYERLNHDSRYADESGLTRQLAGLTYRPVPALSLKIEADRYDMNPSGGACRPIMERRWAWSTSSACHDHACLVRPDFLCSLSAVIRCGDQPSSPSTRDGFTENSRCAHC